MPSKDPFAASLAQFADALRASFASSVAAQREDQLKTPVKNLLESPILSNKKVIARSEAQVEGLGGRPDFGLDVDGLLGYVDNSP